MSLILDALNRSRESEQDIPGLASQHGPAAHPAARNWLQWALAGGLLLAVTAIAWLLLDRDSASPPRQAPLAVQQQGPVSPPAPEPAAAPVEAVSEALPEPEVAVSQPADQAPAQQPRIGATASAGSDPEVVASPEVAALYDTPKPAAPAQPAPVETTVARTAPAAKEPEPTEPEPVVQEQPVDIESLVTRAEEELANARLAEHPAPFLADLSQQAKDGIPTILYQRHDYSGRPGESSVVLNGKTLRAGGKAGSGVRVDEILPDSVVLTHNGAQFRLRALNSWVNL